jgi:DNA polymerase-3 subunit gamma/tau
VESIRTLRDNAAFAPVRGPYKIYLIDEVHMLTTAAFNALLKTLEEPPEHVKFIFATTEAQKLPATITSRCQRFDLSRLKEQEIADHLIFIAQKEEILLLPDAALAIAHGADGALRDAESMMDQLVAFCGKTITQDQVQHIFGFTSGDLVRELGRSIITLDIHAALSLIEAQSNAGKDLSRLLSDLILFFRDLLIEAVHPSLEQTPLSKLRDLVAPEKLLNLLEELGRGEERLRWATNKKLQCDVLMIKAIHLLQEVTLSEVLDSLRTIREGKGENALEAVQPIIKTPSNKPNRFPLKPSHENDSYLPEFAERPSSKAIELVAKEAPFPKKSHHEKRHQAQHDDSKTILTPQALEKSDIHENIMTLDKDPWSDIASSLSSESPLKFGWLQAGRFCKRNKHEMMIEFPASYQAQTETLFWSQARKKIQERLAKTLGEKVELVTLFTGAEVPEEPLHDEIPEVLPAREITKKNAPPSAKKNPPTPLEHSSAIPLLTSEEMNHFKNDPLIQKALELFEAEIIG